MSVPWHLLSAARRRTLRGTSKVYAEQHVARVEWSSIRGSTEEVSTKRARMRRTQHRDLEIEEQAQEDGDGVDGVDARDELDQ